MYFRITYEPIRSHFTKLQVVIQAINQEHARIKFYSSEEAKNCLGILHISEV